MSSDIDIAKYLARLEAYGMQHPLNAIVMYIRFGA
jgi:hypothetical protein